MPYSMPGIYGTLLVGQECKINPRVMIIFVIVLLLRQGFENFALPHRAPEYISLCTELRAR
jgi:hypothetical protein